jgi:hypothetical protein
MQNDYLSFYPKGPEPALIFNSGSTNYIKDPKEKNFLGLYKLDPRI